MEASVDNVEEDLAVDANQNTEEDKDGEDEGGGGAGAARIIVKVL